MENTATAKKKKIEYNPAKYDVRTIGYGDPNFKAGMNIYELHALRKRKS